MQIQPMIMAGSKEWHEERKLGIGGSDASAALGLSKWKTPYQLYMEKIGETEPEDETWEMGQGKAMEPLLRQHYADTTGREIMLPVGPMIHSKYPFMRYNPDGLTAVRLQEFKTAAFGKEWGEAGTDEIPQEYLLQVQHGMIVTGRAVADVTVSIAGRRPKYFEVEADKELQEMIIDGEAAFWERVKHQMPPDPISNEDVARMYSKVNGATIIISPDIAASLIALKDVRSDLKVMEERKEQLEVEIKDYMGANEILADENMVPLITWKQAKGAERFDVKRFREEHPLIAPAYTNTGEPTRRFLVK